MRFGLTLLAATLALFAGLRASPRADAGESAGWRLGPDDFASYRIEVLERRDTKLDGFARWGEIDDIAGFHGYELTDGARRVSRAITHPQLLYAPFVFTLPARPVRGARTGFKEVHGGTWRMRPFAAHGHVEVTAGTAETGAPRLELAGRVTFEDARSEQVAYRRLQSGRLAWTAVFDLERGVMESVTYVLAWTTTQGTQARPKSVHGVSAELRSVEERIRLTLDRVLAYRYPGFQRDVDRAIEEGLAHLESQQRDDGSWRRFGTSALALLALVDGGRPAEHPSVRRGFDWLLRQTPWVEARGREAVYGTGLALMALERRRTPPLEVERRRRGQATAFLPRTLTGVERAWTARCVGFLLDAARVEGQASQRGRPVTGQPIDERWRWGYGRADSETYWDNSNSQYAVLGLESAARCGIPVPRTVWHGVANHFMAAQAPDGRERRDLVLEHERPDERTDERPGAGGTRPGTRSRAPAVCRSRGWHYAEMGEADPGRAPHYLTYGAMTAAGIGSLAIARSRIAQGPFARRHADVLERIDQSILDGYASLDDMFTVWMHPRYEGWYTYYLYGLERAGMLTAVRRIGGHDWYWEGAVQLLLRQSTYGQGGHRFWSYDYNDRGSTPWAILFLKRGTPPVITPP